MLLKEAKDQTVAYVTKATIPNLKKSVSLILHLLSQANTAPNQTQKCALKSEPQPVRASKCNPKAILIKARNILST